MPGPQRTTWMALLAEIMSGNKSRFCQRQLRLELLKRVWMGSVFLSLSVTGKLSHEVCFPVLQKQGVHWSVNTKIQSLLGQSLNCDDPVVCYSSYLFTCFLFRLLYWFPLFSRVYFDFRSFLPRRTILLIYILVKCVLFCSKSKLFLGLIESISRFWLDLVAFSSQSARHFLLLQCEDLQPFFDIWDSISEYFWPLDCWSCLLSVVLHPVIYNRQTNSRLRTNFNLFIRCRKWMIDHVTGMSMSFCQVGALWLCSTTFKSS